MAAPVGELCNNQLSASVYTTIKNKTFIALPFSKVYIYYTLF